MKTGTVSVIVLNWNGGGFVVPCLESLLEQTYPHMDVMVVDNGSTDGSRQVIRERFRDLPLMENGVNLGYCRANNLAIPHTQGEYLLFLNTDVVLEPEYLENAVEVFGRDPHIGMVSGKLLRFGGEVIDSTGQFLGRSRKAIERGYNQPDDHRYQEPGYVFSVCGAAALYRKQMMEEIEVGGEFFDEDFFTFHEDLDVGWRASRFGWKGYYCPQAVAYHFRGGWLRSRHRGRKRYFPLRFATPDLQYHMVKNRYLAIMKNDSLKTYLKDLPFIWSRDLILFTYLLLRRPSVLFRLWRGREVFRRTREKREFLDRMLGKRIGISTGPARRADG